MYITNVFCYYEHEKNNWHSFFNETIPVTYEPAAILITALLCIIKNEYFISKNEQFWKIIN